jgi:hypothetical protein
MTMTKDEFRQLFIGALNVAAQTAERRLGGTISRAFAIDLHAPPSRHGLVTVDEALDRLYLGNDRFYRIIDIAVTDVAPDRTVAFVRVSGHAPDKFGDTWDPSGAGPFKQLSAQPIEDHRVLSG